MQQDVEGGHEEISSRHPLSAPPFGAILVFLGVRRRRGPRDDGRSATTVAGPWFVLEPTGSAARTGIVSAALAIGGVIPIIVGMGVLYLLMPVAMFFNRSLRQMDARPRGEAPGPAPVLE
jgi:hypothetical protein